MKNSRALLLAAALLAFGSTIAMSQSNPGLVYKQVPSAAQWNSYFAVKQDYNSTLTALANGTGPLTPGQYGDATHCAYVTVNAAGIITGISQSTSCPSTGGGSPAGSTGALQYNNAGAFGGLGLGTTTTVLHGNASGAPTFGAINLGTDVSSILPSANGGAGTIAGLLKANGSGVTSLAVIGTDFAAPFTTGQGLTGASTACTTACILAATELLGNGGAAITGTTYTVNLTTDVATQLLFTGSSGSAWTLGAPAIGKGFDVNNRGSATITITASGNINGAATLVLVAGQWAHIYNDGSTWWAEVYSAGGGGTINSGTAHGAAYYGAIGTTLSDGSTHNVTVGNLEIVGGDSAPTNGLFYIGGNSWRAVANGQTMFEFIGTGTYTTVSQSMIAASGTGMWLQASGTTATAPVIGPTRADYNTGIGSNGAGQLDMIVGNVDKGRWTAEGLQYKQATAPVPTGTGTPTIRSGSTDEAGEVTAGTSATSIVITFNLTHTNAPFCVVTSQTQLAAFAYTLSNTAITITQTATSANKVNYRCTFP